MKLGKIFTIIGGVTVLGAVGIYQVKDNAYIAMNVDFYPESCTAEDAVPGKRPGEGYSFVTYDFNARTITSMAEGEQSFDAVSRGEKRFIEKLHKFDELASCPKPFAPK